MKHQPSPHKFHIPVLGLGYSIDTPLKVARFGISSVISIMDDHLIEKMRAYHSAEAGICYEPISTDQEDHRACRITAYLDLVNELVNRQTHQLRTLPFNEDNDLQKYFEMLPGSSSIKEQYRGMNSMPEGAEKYQAQKALRNSIVPGFIDVNIMVKLDKNNMDATGNELPFGYSDALAAFRGFANSKLNSSVIFSAGYNPRLYGYIENFPDFFPDKSGNLKKRIILKVSDYRSALTQGKILAKRGLWISEFRIESGLNCGGHAFPTDGLLLGPILEEFKTRREELVSEIFSLCNAANALKGNFIFTQAPEMKITVQGGIGTSNENEFLLEHFGMDGTGWGSPFLLVPEATNVDEGTIKQLVEAKKEDYYMSYASPLGIAFNNFRKSSAEKLRKERIAKGRPGSPCYKKFLSSNTEFTAMPICTSSREYQNHKILQLKEKNLSPEAHEIEFNRITEKDCLCEGLGASVLLKDKIPLSHNLAAVAICPGPNLAYFSGIYSLHEMISHIYGRINILNTEHRPNMFINELHLYIDYFKEKIAGNAELNPKQVKQLLSFKANLLSGIGYYKEMLSNLKKESARSIAAMRDDLDKAIHELSNKIYAI
jgi:hypothetical protein